MHQPTRSKEKLSVSEEVPQPEPGRSVQEEEKVEEKARLRAAVVYEIIRAEGEGELARAGSALWWSGLAAGISMGFSFLGHTHIVAGSAEINYGWLVGQVSVADGILVFLLPTLAGNVVGGTLLFGVLSYRQVREEIDE